MKKSEKRPKQGRKAVKRVKLKQNATKQRVITISVVSAVVVLALSLGLFFVLRGSFNQEPDMKDEIAETTEEELTEWEKTVKDLVTKVDDEIKKINDTPVCSDGMKEGCLVEEEKESRVKELNNFKNRIDDLEEGDDGKYSEIKSALEELLKSKEDDKNEKEEVKEDTTKTNTSTASSNKNTGSNVNAPSSNSGQNNGNASNVGVATSSQFIRDVNSVALNPVLTRRQYVDDEVGRIINSVTNNSMSNYEKLLAVYNYVISSMQYNTGNNVFDLSEAFARYESYNYAFSFYGSDLEAVYWAEQALRDRSGVCDTYAGFLLVLTRRLGFNTYTVEGANIQGSGHTWNYIDTGNNKYILDAQGDDNGVISRNYYFGVNYNDYRTRYSQINFVHPFNYFRETQ